MDKKTVLEDKQTVSDTTMADENVEISPRTGKPIEKKYAPKTKKKPRGGNNWLKPENMYDLEAGDNTKFLSLNMELFNMETIDMNDVEQVQTRLNDYFALYAKYDTKPTVAGMALALNGMRRQQLWAIVNDAPTGSSGYKASLPSEVATSIKRAYFLLENLWENYMQNGKVNPVAGIFLGKNNYGYQDKTEYVLTPNTNQDNDYNADEIRERYIAADQQKRLEQGSDDSED